jgi:hypothetical protein
MSGKLEAGFWRSIERLLPGEIYCESMSNQFKGGTPDRYYENDQILWVEYKFFKTVPGEINLVGKTVLSPKQVNWLSRCHHNGHQVAVIVGMPDRKGVILKKMEWDMIYSKEEFIEMAITKKEIANWINRSTVVPWSK